jgi:hypothetical protein
MPDLFGVEITRFLVKSIGAMSASTLAAMAPFQMVFFSEDNKSFFAVIEIFGFKFVAPFVRVHEKVYLNQRCNIFAPQR